MEETRELAVVEERVLTPAILQMFNELDQTAHSSRKFGVSLGETTMKLLFAWENQLPLSVANNGLYIHKGRLGVEGSVVAGAFKRHPHYDYRIDELDNKGCKLSILWDGEAVGQVAWGEEDAKLAGLLGGNKDTYTKYPSDMYFNRALSRAKRRYAPDLLFGSVYVRGEADPAPAEDDVWEITSGPAIADPEEAIPTEKAPEQTAAEEPPALVGLVQQYGAMAVMDANAGIIPATQEEVNLVADRLAEEVAPWQ